MVGCYKKMVLSFLCVVLNVFSAENERYDLIMTTAQNILKADNVVLASLQGGSRADVFKASVSCVVRCISKDNPLEWREHEISVAQHAAAEGFGPRVLYANAEKGIVVMELLTIQAPPRNLFGTQEWCHKLGILLRQLHTTPQLNGKSFVSIFENCHSALSDDSSHAIASLLSLDRIKDRVKECEVLCADIMCPHVTSHGDLHDNNLLWTSEGFRIIDYEFVSSDTPYRDISDVLVRNSVNKKHDAILLESYLGRQPTQAEMALTSVIKHIRYIRVGLLWLENRPKHIIDAYISIAEYPDYLAAAYSHGDYSIINVNDMVRYGLACIREAAWYFQSDEFEQDKELLRENKGQMLLQMS